MTLDAVIAGLALRFLRECRVDYQPLSALRVTLVDEYPEIPESDHPAVILGVVRKLVLDRLVAAGIPAGMEGPGVTVGPEEVDRIVQEWEQCGPQPWRFDDRPETPEVVLKGIAAQLLYWLHHPEGELCWFRIADKGRELHCRKDATNEGI